MTEFMWHWTKGNKKVYTLQTDLAEQALREGLLVLAVRLNPYRINPEDMVI